jgi:hypothetical protein
MICTLQIPQPEVWYLHSTVMSPHSDPPPPTYVYTVILVTPLA